MRLATTCFSLPRVARSITAQLAALLALAGCPRQDEPEPLSPADPPRAPTQSAGPCVLTAKSWSERPPQSLAVRERGPRTVDIYGNIHDAKLTLGSSTRLSLFAGPVALDGYVEPSWVEIHVAKAVVAGPFVLSGYRDLSHDVRQWPRTAGDSAQISVEPPAGVDLVRPLVASIPCSSLTMETPSFNAFATFGDPATAGHAALKGGRRIALLDRPRGGVMAHVTLSGAEPVNVVAQDGASSHVVYARSTMLVHGWVGADDLEPFTGSQDERPHLIITGTNADRFDAPNVTEIRVCPHDVILHVMEPKARAPQQLGRIPTGARIGIVLWDHGLTTVFPSDAGIFPVGEGATLVVATKDLDGCKAP